MISRCVLNLAALAWLVVETGNYARMHLPWGNDILFWPLWICLSLVIVLTAKLLDTQYKRRSSSRRIILRF